MSKEVVKCPYCENGVQTSRVTGIPTPCGGLSAGTMIAMCDVCGGDGKTTQSEIDAYQRWLDRPALYRRLVWWWRDVDPVLLAILVCMVLMMAGVLAAAFYDHPTRPM